MRDPSTGCQPLFKARARAFSIQFLTKVKRVDR